MPIMLHQFPPAFGLPVSVSPYCAKLEAYLRVTKREYTTTKGLPMGAPTKTVPFVTWEDGSRTGDSDAIVARLEAEGPALDAELSDAAKQAEVPLFEGARDALYYATLYARFGEGWEHQKATVKALAPPGLGWLLAPIIRADQVRKCRARGADGDGAVAVAVVDAIAERLGDQPFLHGDSIHVIDCDLWGHLVQVAFTPVDFPARAALRGHSNLVAWLMRVAERGEMRLPPMP